MMKSAIGFLGLTGPLVFGLALATAPATAQSLKIGYVNTARLETESVPAQRAMEELRKEFEPRERQIIELQQQIKVDQDKFTAAKSAGTMPAADLQQLGNSIATRMRDSDNMVYGMQADFEQRKKERGAKLIEESVGVIRAVAEQGKYDLIVHEAAFVRSAVDITDQVLKELARRAGN
jgi:outer membrane protein